MKVVRKDMMEEILIPVAIYAIGEATGLFKNLIH